MKSIKDKTEIAKLIEDKFPGIKFRKNIKAKAAKLLKKNKLDEAISHLSDPKNQGEKHFQPPAKCNIIAQSRPFDVWPIYKVSNAIQEYIYSLSDSKMEFSKLKEKKKEEYLKWFTDNCIPNFGYEIAQGLNLIFTHAYNIYEGVKIKVENRNKKYKEKIEKRNEYLKSQGIKEESFVEEEAIDENGYLKNKPGINKNIYCYQNCNLHLLDKNKDIDIISLLPILKDFDSEYEDLIPIGVENRLEILKDHPGYIPIWQRPFVNKRRQRIRRYGEKVSGAIPLIVRVGIDWVVIDARGLLRNICWRKLVNRKELTFENLIEFFTEDPVIDTERKIVTFLYKNDKTNIISKRPISYKKAHTILNEPCVLTSIDLGQNHFLAAKISEINNKNGKLKSIEKNRTFLPDSIIELFKSYRDKYNDLNDKLYDEAKTKLTKEQEDEIYKRDNTNAQQTKLTVCSKYGILESDLPWDIMTNGTYYIADYLIKLGINESEIYFTDGKKVKRKRTDKNFCNFFKIKLSEETRNALSKAKWNLQSNSNEYKKLSILKFETARRAVNWLYNEAKKFNDKVIFNVENLNHKDHMFSGAGKRDPGWDNFFVSKKENRWFIEVLNKSIVDYAQHRGVSVIESWPSNTSITCTECNYCDKKNRNGINFECLKCHYVAHADLYIATDNLEKVALTGQALSGERLNDEQKTVSASKVSKHGKIKENKSAILDITPKDQYPTNGNQDRSQDDS